LSAALTAVAPLQKDKKGAGRCHVDTLRDQMTFIEISSLRAEVGKPFPKLFVNFAAHRTYLNSNCDTCGGVRVDCHITIRLSKKQLTKKNLATLLAENHFFWHRKQQFSELKNIPKERNQHFSHFCIIFKKNFSSYAKVTEILIIPLIEE